MTLCQLAILGSKGLLVVYVTVMIFHVSKMEIKKQWQWYPKKYVHPWHKRKVFLWEAYNVPGEKYSLQLFKGSYQVNNICVTLTKPHFCQQLQIAVNTSSATQYREKSRQWFWSIRHYQWGEISIYTIPKLAISQSETMYTVLTSDDIQTQTWDGRIRVQ